MKTRLIEMARALQKEIRETPEAGFTSEENDALADMEWNLQTFTEALEGRAPMTEPAAPAPARVEAA